MPVAGLQSARIPLPTVFNSREMRLLWNAGLECGRGKFHARQTAVFKRGSGSTGDSRRALDRAGAGCVALYGTATHWAKLCLEAQAAGGFAVISVVTRDLSDDVTSFPVTGTSTWLKVARDHDVFFFYASTDGKTWQIVRKFNLTSPDGFQVGVSAQSPDGDGASAHFTDFCYNGGPVNLWDLR